jgi:hypothetical protein
MNANTRKSEKRKRGIGGYRRDREIFILKTNQPRIMQIKADKMSLSAEAQRSERERH